MKTFCCTCGSRLHFENNLCIQCGKILGYLPDQRRLAPLVPLVDGLWRPDGPEGEGQLYRQCRNYAEEAVCNWMVPVAEHAAYCPSCRLTRVVPNLEREGNRRLWYRIEAAKRRLVYTLDGLGLPLVDKHTDPQQGLAFEFLENPEVEVEFSDAVVGARRVMTGHHAGVITVNLEEADHSAREQTREKMNELYRTLLGHLRHESGHYYWYRLVADSAWLEPFRALFGDERGDYDAALQSYYSEGPQADWAACHVSAYASAHPWEDWAETWAHYLHMVDTLETSDDYGLAIKGRPLSTVVAALEPGRDAIDRLLEDWGYLTTALNDLNRSMGLPDAYPFTVNAVAAEKIRFVHRLVSEAVR